MRIAVESPRAPDVIALLEDHLTEMRATSPPESVHALDVEALGQPHVIFLTARDHGGTLLGVGALVALESGSSEIKSMRTAPAARGRGVAAAVLARLLAVARERGDVKVSLETGAAEFFAPAHRLYERHGFTECEPFGTYVPDPHSRFFTLDLTRSASHQ